MGILQMWPSSFHKQYYILLGKYNCIPYSRHIKLKENRSNIHMLLTNILISLLNDEFKGAYISSGFRFIRRNSLKTVAFIYRHT